MAADRWAAHAAPSSARTAPEQEAQLTACEAHLAEIGRALAAYRREKWSHGGLPAHLTDLFPRSVGDLELFPAAVLLTGQGGSPRLADDDDDEVAPPADPGRSAMPRGRPGQAGPFRFGEWAGLAPATPTTVGAARCWQCGSSTATGVRVIPLLASHAAEPVTGPTPAAPS